MRNERGFTIIELLVGMGIVAVLMAIVVPSFLSAKQSTHSKEAIAAGGAYNAAIAQFQTDHGNMLPGDSDQAPAVQGTPAGPASLLKHSYLKQQPAGVVEGRIGVSMSTGCQAPPSAGQFVGWVAYCPGNLGANAYSIRVSYRSKPGAAWQPSCVIGAPASGLKAC
jgi:prepilin-type N-terminal cleavage/methylation domain-containing protein